MHRSHLGTAGLALALATLLPLAPRASGEEQVNRLTVDHPVFVSLEPLERRVAPGERSALLIHLTIPEGIWIGAAASDVRSPGPTVLAPESDACVQFLPSRWPEPRVEGIPVALGTTRVYTGRVTAVLPFETTSRCTPGERRVRVRITYTPGLSAGHLTPHVGELHEVSIEVSPGAAPRARAVQPSVEPATGLHVERSRARLPRPLDLMLFAVGEDSMPARALHTIWEDPPHHGKEIQGARCIPTPRRRRTTARPGERGWPFSTRRGKGSAPPPSRCGWFTTNLPERWVRSTP